MQNGLAGGRLTTGGSSRARCLCPYRAGQQPRSQHGDTRGRGAEPFGFCFPQRRGEGLAEPQGSLCTSLPSPCPSPSRGLAGSTSSLQLRRGCFPSRREKENAGAVASLSIPLTCRRKIPSLPKHSEPDSPDVGEALPIESLKPASVTSRWDGFTSEIAPGPSIAKELNSLSLNSSERQDPDEKRATSVTATLSHQYYGSCLEQTETFLTGRCAYST